MEYYKVTGIAIEWLPHFKKGSLPEVMVYKRMSVLRVVGGWRGWFQQKKGTE